MHAHHAAARGDPRIKHGLHHTSLLASGGQAYAVALPVALRPRQFHGRLQARNGLEQLSITCPKRAPLVETSRQGKRVLKRLTRKSRRFRELVGKKTTKRSLASLREAILTLSEIVIRAEHDQRLLKP